MKRSRIKPVSQKRSEAIPKRQELRQAQLTRKSLCEARIATLCQIGATDVHKLINRSQRSTAWLEPELFVSLCRKCHSWVTQNPKWANRHGLSLSAWQYEPKIIAQAKQVRTKCNEKDCVIDHMEPMMGICE